ncbi:hypothetical protein CR513_21288, partial [Mucuna pruriens]
MLRNGGALMDKTPAVARHLISNMASNIGPSQAQMVNEIGAASNQSLLLDNTNQPLRLKFVAYVLLWSTPLTCAPRYKRQSQTNQKTIESRALCSSTLNAHQRQAGYQQPTPQYQAPTFQQQQQ